jgi:penicillin-insensitive murein DD-endopeptidase
MRAAVLFPLVLAACIPQETAGPDALVPAQVTKSSHSGALANKLFGALKTASSQPAAPIGAYAKGCLAGARALPDSGPTWQAMRLSRNRNWGHPALISFIERLSRFAATQEGWAGLYIGDMAQPRGGPMTSAHQSHQVGLDTDIWLYPPKRLNLSRAERETLSSVSVRSRDGRSVTSNWTQEHMNILRQAAKDPAVERIFITAPAKIWMCEHAGTDRKWLQKIRPLWGHEAHFHVRLKCPDGAEDCETQSPSVAALSKGGDGCDETLQWWVTEALKPPKPRDPNAPVPPKKRGARDYVMADLPAQCQAVLDAR